MVRLNNKGLRVPIKMEDFKKLPLIPNTASHLKKKHLTDMVPGRHFADDSVEEIELRDEDSDESVARGPRRRNKSTVEDETTTVFDLVHRGR